MGYDWNVAFVMQGYRCSSVLEPNELQMRPQLV